MQCESNNIRCGENNHLLTNIRRTEYYRVLVVFIRLPATVGVVIINYT